MLCVHTNQVIRNPKVVKFFSPRPEFGNSLGKNFEFQRHRKVFQRLPLLPDESGINAACRAATRVNRENIRSCAISKHEQKVKKY